MSIAVESFGINSEGKAINLYTIINKNGAVLKLTDMGAAWVALIVPDKNGRMEDVVLGYESGEEYEINNNAGMGAIIGRNANRICRHRFSLNGVKYNLEDNGRGDNLHSGPDFYFSRLWEAEPVETELGEGVEFTLFSPHMDQGFPGNLNITVSYVLTEDDSVIIEYSGVSDEDTIVNMTSHAYFNLAGHKAGSVNDELVWIDADYFTHGADDMVTTGELCPVEGTPMDFRQLKRIGEDINTDYEPLRRCEGYDHNYCLNTKPCEVSLVAKLVDDRNGRVMDVFTNLPGMQFYTGNYLCGGKKGKEGMSYHRGCGVAFETQFYPDAINQPQFPSPVVKAGEHFFYSTIYRFSVIE